MSYIVERKSVEQFNENMKIYFNSVINQKSRNSEFLLSVEIGFRLINNVRNLFTIILRFVYLFLNDT